MRRVLMAGLAAVVCSLLGAALYGEERGSSGPSTAATVPRLVRFSGVLKDQAGKPLVGPVDVGFLLYKEQAGGEPLWFETQTVQADGLGRYSVLLGAMHADGLPMDLFSSGEARWLGVQVGKLPEPPRVPGRYGPKRSELGFC